MTTPLSCVAGIQAPTPGVAATLPPGAPPAPGTTGPATPQTPEGVAGPAPRSEVERVPVPALPGATLGLSVAGPGGGGGCAAAATPGPTTHGSVR